MTYTFFFQLIEILISCLPPLPYLLQFTSSGNVQYHRVVQIFSELSCQHEPRTITIYYITDFIKSRKSRVYMFVSCQSSRKSNIARNFVTIFFKCVFLSISYIDNFFFLIINHITLISLTLLVFLELRSEMDNSNDNRSIRLRERFAPSF